MTKTSAHKMEPWALLQSSTDSILDWKKFLETPLSLFKQPHVYHLCRTTTTLILGFQAAAVPLHAVAFLCLDFLWCAVHLPGVNAIRISHKPQAFLHFLSRLCHVLHSKCHPCWSVLLRQINVFIHKLLRQPSKAVIRPFWSSFIIKHLLRYWLSAIIGVGTICWLFTLWLSSCLHVWNRWNSGQKSIHNSYLSKPCKPKGSESENMSWISSIITITPLHLCAADMAGCSRPSHHQKCIENVLKYIYIYETIKLFSNLTPTSWNSVNRK